MSVYFVLPWGIAGAGGSSGRYIPNNFSSLRTTLWQKILILDGGVFMRAVLLKNANPPQASSMIAINPETKRPKITCSRCQNALVLVESFALAFKGNTAVVFVCADCLAELEKRYPKDDDLTVWPLLEFLRKLLGRL